MILDRFRMTDKVAIVTGAGRGIGEGCALAFAEQGADWCCAARTPEQLEAVAARVRGARTPRAGGPLRRERAQRPREPGRARASREFGRIDVVVNNAGGSPPRPALETSEKMFEAAFHFNVTTAFTLSRLAIPHMQKAGRRLDREHLLGGGPHAAAELRRLRHRQGRALVHDAPAGGRVRAGGARERDRRRGGQDLRADAVPERRTARARWRSSRRCKRLGEVEDIATMALYLASPASSWVTGKVFEVDGGTESTNWPF